ncbi:hypothetical protein KBZ18_16275 [Synechococcus sp. Cruz-9H2]|uniref:hypothetical protein n=1 Tax=unclassified Synechococcus TaxID=2626047 RepID=UPI0020CEDB6B|nr:MULTISPECIES: hypothetical protein [unclassified Synechococcus]MCP9821034.1 hypothetical protein [Synechococcus sp. Cruz-9H2]MCP9845269.1 hypothetical protein [Synechococcus sp. Edmonson 11F2]MCP9857431.1 hypothetical protein [Synechococcus sp. Cruz-9C9]MCP9864670.1 hypothetical protein [Synechococcus sp. Cruz-7E5]MCP9871947.1 hypothetical protein [Synechococcus sp. Cruz-7B9]
MLQQILGPVGGEVEQFTLRGNKGRDNQGLLKKADPLRRSLFQQSRVDKLALIRAINDCYNC